MMNIRGLRFDDPQGTVGTRVSALEFFTDDSVDNQTVNTNGSRHW